MLTPKGKAEAELEVKKSRFIALALQVFTPEEVKQKLKETRSRYRDATHVVHAFITGDHGDIFGMSDDREPRGTAGRPVLEVLKGSGITNILILVVRYFGGTKLGTGGLVKAYTRSAQKVLEALPVEECVDKTTFTLELPYDTYDGITKCLRTYGAEIETESFAVHITLTGTIPRRHLEQADKEIQTLSKGAVALDSLIVPKR